MKRIIYSIIFFLFLVISPALVRAEDTLVIDNLESKINIQGDGKVSVSETVNVDFGTSQKHGIFRDIPIVYYTGGAPVYTEVNIVSVGSSASTTGYEVYRKGDFMEVKIGDPNKLISGKVEYQINYVVIGVLKSFADHDELYWDVTGNNWPSGFKSVSATVTLANGNIWKITCFEGVFRSKESCKNTTVSPVKAYFETARALSQGEDFTIVVGFPKNTFPVLTVNAPKQPANYSYNYSNSLTPELNLWVFIPIVSIGLFIILRLWLGNGKDQRLGNETIMVEYKAPNYLKPAEMGTLVDERADTLDVTATIIDLASKGFLTIEEKEKKWVFGTTDYIFKRITHDETDLLEYEKLLLSKLFDKGDNVKLSELKLNFYKDLVLVKKEIYKNILDKKFFFSDPEKIRGIYIGFGIALIFSGGVFGSIIGFSDSSGIFLAIGLSSLLLGIALIVISPAMPKKTLSGRSLYIKCLGYKLFLDKVETYKQRFLEDKNLFNEVLPYTIIFGITQKFAKAFKDLGIVQPQPGWYISSRPFNLYYFGNSMNTLSSSLTQAIAQAPSRGNFASGGSGFGGGGFSGGGFGGGGGGSW